MAGMMKVNPAIQRVNVVELGMLIHYYWNAEKDYGEETPNVKSTHGKSKTVSLAFEHLVNLNLITPTSEEARISQGLLKYSLTDRGVFYIKHILDSVPLPHPTSGWMIPSKDDK